jgi:hypothetical protein
LDSVAKQADPVFDAGVAQPPLDIFEIDHASNTGE